MANFIFNPENFKNWSSKVKGLLGSNVVESGIGSEVGSFYDCSVKFEQALGDLVNNKVWTGPAAEKNYQVFTDTYASFGKFVNAFGNAFESLCSTIKTQVTDLETTNLGVVGEWKLSTSFTALKENIKTATIDTQVYKYDTEAIKAVGVRLKEINDTVTTIKEALIKEIEKINVEMEEIYVSSSAETIKSELKASANLVDNIKANLDTCITNVKQAAENAAAL